MKTDISVKKVSITITPHKNRVPLKFGHEITTASKYCRAYITVQDTLGRSAVGVGETPVAVAWTWPSELSFSAREVRMVEFCNMLCESWNNYDYSGHPMEIGYSFIRDRLDVVLSQENALHPEEDPMPYLSALVCNSLFDIALHDAFAKLNNISVYDSFTAQYMNHDLSWYYNYDTTDPTERAHYEKVFGGKYPGQYFVQDVPTKLPVWHLVGGTDPLEKEDLKGTEPNDGIPVLLRDWIREDGLDCLKIKLRGNDEPWDYDRIVKVGAIADEMGVSHLTADFNCTVYDPEYVNRILDKLKVEHPITWEKILYIEQPFPYDMEKYPIDVHALSARKLLLMDESAHDWHFVKLGVELGWTGVALKTCKTFTGALLMFCYAKEANLALMVQDLTNPGLAMMPHASLAAHVGTIMGVESNGPQYCPGASVDETRVHPGLYKRRGGCIDISTLSKIGFGYRLDEIEALAKEAAK
ncbi:MAG: mandelate racemase/muconate lactonizing enzyme family protein [Sphaerochaetaceae bacterium]|nr:mandelate racemase/muconate lactonizing enzyme family protein [Sphaerochaetaceae bacterium]